MPSRNVSGEERQLGHALSQRLGWTDSGRRPSYGEGLATAPP